MPLYSYSKDKIRPPDVERVIGVRGITVIRDGIGEDISFEVTAPLTAAQKTKLDALLTRLGYTAQMVA